MRQVMTEVDPPDLALWGLHCFCLGARRTPHRAICSDSNGVILYQARNGVTRAALAAQGVPCSDSQVALLEMLGVLSVSGDELRASMPILGAAPMTRLRRRCQDHAAVAASRLAQPVHEVRRALAETGSEDHHYAVLFGHGLDGLTWEHLRQCRELPSTELTIDHPYWNGMFWAIHPKRAKAAGTNEVMRGKQTLVTVWTEETVDELSRTSKAWARGESSMELPIVHATAVDPIHTACDQIGRTAATALRALTEELHADGFGNLNRGQLLLVAGHEFIWELADELGRIGVLIAPRRPGDDGTADRWITSWMYVRAPC
jgi:hypothetical protein